MHADTKCKNCGYPLGQHRLIDEACPASGTLIAGSQRFRLNSKFSLEEDALPGNVVLREIKPFEMRNELRKVEFTRYLQKIERDRLKAAGKDAPTKLEGINGWFHCWGHSYEEFADAGPGNYTTAIIEVEDGTVYEIIPSDVKFLS